MNEFPYFIIHTHNFISSSAAFFVVFFAHRGDRFCPPFARMVSWQIGNEDLRERTNFPTPRGNSIEVRRVTYVPFYSILHPLHGIRVSFLFLSFSWFRKKFHFRWRVTLRPPFSLDAEPRAKMGGAE